MEDNKDCSIQLKTAGTPTCSFTIYNPNNKLNARMQDGRAFTMYKPCASANDECFMINNNNKTVEEYISDLKDMGPDKLKNKLGDFDPNFLYSRDKMCQSKEITTVPLKKIQSCANNGCSTNTYSNLGLGLGRPSDKNNFNPKTNVYARSEDSCDPCDIDEGSGLVERANEGAIWKAPKAYDYTTEVATLPDFRYKTHDRTAPATDEDGNRITLSSAEKEAAAKKSAAYLRKLAEERNETDKIANINMMDPTAKLIDSNCENIPYYQQVIPGVVRNMYDGPNAPCRDVPVDKRPPKRDWKVPKPTDAQWDDPTKVGLWLNNDRTYAATGCDGPIAYNDYIADNYECPQ